MKEGMSLKKAAKSERIERIGVELWEEDLWREIITAAIDGHPDQVQLDGLAGFDRPAASRYAATTPNLLNWFREYNEGCPYANRVRPFNFLLSLQAKSLMQSAAEDPYTAAGRTSERQAPRPAAPFHKDVLEAARRAFDRKTKKPIPIDQLRSLSRALVRYHLHPEAKFWGGDYDQSGRLTRRHIVADTVQAIGKETDDLDARETIGNPDAEITYNFSPEDKAKLIAEIKRAKDRFGVRALSAAAKVSHHRLNDITAGKAVSDQVLTALSDAGRALDRAHETEQAAGQAALRCLADRVAKEGRNKLARLLETDPSNLTKILAGERRMSEALMRRLERLAKSPSNAGRRPM
jgi:hypothetical protein